VEDGHFVDAGAIQTELDTHLISEEFPFARDSDLAIVTLINAIAQGDVRNVS